jgi:hypothetical protein
MPESGGCQVCACGRSFSQPGAYHKHQSSCQRVKKRLSSALSVAKGLLVAKKRRRLQVNERDVVQPSEAQSLNILEPGLMACSGPEPDPVAADSQQEVRVLVQ